MKRKPPNYWNDFNRCKSESLKYDNKTNFHKKSKGAYESARKNGWLNEICMDMSNANKPVKYWDNFDRCKSEALKYKMKTEFKQKNYTAYIYAKNNNWLESITTHMVNKNPDNVERIFLVYVYEFSDKHAYIGISSNIKKRKNNHITEESSPVFKHNKLTNINPYFKVLESNISIDNIGKLEEKYINLYTNNNWVLLNISKAGSIGSNNIKWTLEKCKEVSLLCKTRSEFEKKYPSAKNAAIRYGWYNSITYHMEYIIKPSGYWTLEKCKDIALLFNSRSILQTKRKDVYMYSYRNGWLDEICNHMKK